MSEGMPGWGEFQSAISQLESAVGGSGGGAGGGGSGGIRAEDGSIVNPNFYGGGNRGGTRAEDGSIVNPNFYSGGSRGGRDSIPVRVDVGNLSREQVAPLLQAGFRGDPTDNREALYGSNRQLGNVPDAARYNIPIENFSSTRSGALPAEDRTFVGPEFYG